MTAARFDVLGIGNAIVDIIGRCDDAFLKTHGLNKGTMRLVEAEELSRLYGKMGPAIEISGGSAANTIAGIASFGGRAAFIGKVADDEFGRIFGHDIRAQGVTFETPRVAGSLPTSRSLILVTPEGERTMSTFLGVSTHLDHGEVDRETVAASRIVYLEGYLFDRPQAKAAFHQAASFAREAGRLVALTLSDPFCVERHRGEFMALISERADIVFANENELVSLYRVENVDAAIAAAAKARPLFVVTRGAKGSVALKDGRRVEIAAEPVARVIDTTGAGDLYAAGFLLGLAKGQDLKTCGQLGSLAAAEIIGHIGARPEVQLQILARKKGLPI
jgi:sugar/nucleoside kinase (ribokinase family)